MKSAETQLTLGVRQIIRVRLFSLTLDEMNGSPDKLESWQVSCLIKIEEESA